MEDIKKQIKAVEDQLNAIAKEEVKEGVDVSIVSANNEKKQTLTEQKANLEARLSEEESEALEIKYPTAVKEKDKLNIILIGPEKCGKTTVANYLA